MIALTGTLHKGALYFEHGLLWLWSGRSRYLENPGGTGPYFVLPDKCRLRHFSVHIYIDQVTGSPSLIDCIVSKNGSDFYSATLPNSNISNSTVFFLDAKISGYSFDPGDLFAVKLVSTVADGDLILFKNLMALHLLEFE